MRRQKHHHFGNPFFAASIELTLAGWESLNWTVETFQLDMQPGSCVLPHGAGFPVSSGQSEVENFLLNIHRDPSWLQFFFFVKICWLNRDQCDLPRGFNGIARCRWMKVNSRVAMVPWRVETFVRGVCFGWSCYKFRIQDGWISGYQDFRCLTLIAKNDRYSEMMLDDLLTGTVIQLYSYCLTIYLTDCYGFFLRPSFGVWSWRDLELAS